jgi:hypothetical protein
MAAQDPGTNAAQFRLPAPAMPVNDDTTRRATNQPDDAQNAQLSTPGHDGTAASNSAPDAILSALIPQRSDAADSNAVQPIIVRAQESFSPASPDYPIPTYRENIEEGGFYSAMEFIMWRMSIPIGHQLVAIRGFFNSTLGAGSGALQGSGNPALYTSDVSGPVSEQPGWIIDLGWKFADGTVVSVDWLHIQKYTYSAAAYPVPPGFVTTNAADSFISSFVYNFPAAYSGPPTKPANMYGIWNGADAMQIFFTQRYDQYDLTWRQTIVQDDMFRCYGMIGPRFAWIWERFQWITTTAFAQSSVLDVGVYNNIVSNRMYGFHVGSGSDWWLGNGFAATLEFQAAPFLDVVKEWAAYQLGEHLPLIRNKRGRRDYNLAGEVQGNIYLTYYPIQGVQLRLGYEAMAFFNTIAAKDPIDFNMGAIAPPYEHDWFRLFYGFDAGISFIF